MAGADRHEALASSSRQYRRGALLGMTMAEAFILIAFALLLLLAAWKTQADGEIERYRRFADLTPEQIRDVDDLASAGRLDAAARMARSESFEALREIEESGVDPETIASTTADQERWRFIDKDELRRILEGAQELPEDLQKDLADLVEIEDHGELMRILEMTERAGQDSALRDRLAGIGAQLGAVREAEADLVADMRETLGGVVAGVSGRIDENGSVILQDSILFDLGSARLKPRMRAFLDEMCVPWMRVMMRSRAAVSGAQIEGHASSEWRANTSTGEA